MRDYLSAHYQLCGRYLLPLLLLLASVTGLAATGQAGGGPENVFLLVNANSIDSMTVANHYIDLRQIPPQNVFYVDWKRPVSQTLGSLFRRDILMPALKEIDSRKLGGQVDYLVYSCDFPWRILFKGEFPDVEFPRHLAPAASLNGATYLWPFVQQKKKEVISLKNNFYYAPRRNNLTVTRAFRASYAWNPDGRRTTREKGIPYLLSTMLGVTDGRGNTVEEIIRYLRSAASADGTNPPGIIYYVKNNGVRSKTRHDDFDEAVADLKLAGVHAIIENGQFLKNKGQVMGVTSGAPTLNIPTSGTSVMPGALGDNLTSAGGNLVKRKLKGAAQTPVSEFLRFGFAGASGTVVEPLSIAQKFPSAFLHLHYARGASLAEAFYQSVSGPYQLLIVGDPLCQPWAKAPQIEVEELESEEKISGKIKISPRDKSESLIRSRFFELYLDGKRQKRMLPGESYELDTAKLADGYHRITVVAVDNTPIETQGRWSKDIVVKNGVDAVQLSVDPKTLRAGIKTLSVNVASSTPTKVMVYHNGRIMSEIERGTGIALIPIDKLGKGPVTLVAETDTDPGVRSRPLRVVVP